MHRGRAYGLCGRHEGPTAVRESEGELGARAPLGEGGAPPIDLRAAGRRGARGRARTGHVLLLATVDTKAEEVAYAVEALAENGVVAHVHDVSLHSGGRRLSDREKLRAMQATAHEIIHGIGPLLGPHYRAIVGIGGGTGGQIIIDVMRALPFSYPKVLVTTLPFDPRDHVADTSIILVPALADICGLNATLRQVLDNAAAMVAGICCNPRPPVHAAEQPSIGITALGSTHAGVDALVRLVRGEGREATVFHSNGYGGAAFARWCASGAFDAAIDYTTHEITRLHVAGAHTTMPHRFTGPARAGIPHVVLPGGMNFLGLGGHGLVPGALLQRPHYRHSALFTHVKLTGEEMALCAAALATELLRGGEGGAEVSVIVPMGGFSGEDRPGGAIEDEALRGVFLDTIREELGGRVPVAAIDAHINDEACARAALDAVLERL